MSEPAFVFWGPFAAFAAITALYVLWMWRVERDPSGNALNPPRDRHRRGPEGGAGPHTP
jgi:hypothetical protein